MLGGLGDADRESIHVMLWPTPEEGQDVKDRLATSH